MKQLYKKVNFKGFTLVELLVVISILAILATIAFLSFSYQTSKARDSTRITDTSSIRKGLEIYNSQSGIYPMPEGTIYTGTINSAVVLYRGIVGDNISSIIKISKVPTDPLDISQNYPYGITYDQKHYEIGMVLEKSNIGAYIIQNIYADSTFKAKVSGNYGGIIKYKIGTDTYLANIPSLLYFNNSNNNPIDLTDNQTYYVIDENTNLPYSIKQATTNNKDTNQILIELTGSGTSYLTGVNITTILNTTDPTERATLISQTFSGDLLTSFNNIGATASPIAIQNSIEKVLFGDKTTASQSNEDDNDSTYLDCTFNSTPVLHSSSVTAYLTGSVPYGNTCTSEQRTCNNGTLSGTYAFTGCTVDGATGTFNLSATSITQGTNVTITNNCSVAPTSYTGSNTAVATINNTTKVITTLSAGITNITPVGGACGDIASKVLTVIVPVPTKPIASAATSITTTSITWNWQAVSGATYYEWSKDGVTWINKGTNLNHAETGLVKSTIYSNRQLRACNEIGCSGITTFSNITTACQRYCRTRSHCSKPGAGLRLNRSNRTTTPGSPTCSYIIYCPTGRTLDILSKDYTCY